MPMETVEPTADVGGTYGTAARNRDELPAHRLLDDWCKTRRPSVYWEGPGGLCTVESEEARRVELGLDNEGLSGKAPCKKFCVQADGAFAVPMAVKCDRISVASDVEARYVAEMAAYLFTGEGDLSSLGPEQWRARFRRSETGDSGDAGYEQKQVRLAYALSVRAAG